MPSSHFFLTLNIFSATGGIEKVCRIAGKALYEQSVQQQQRLRIWSMHDREGDAVDNPYFPTELYKCFGARKVGFVSRAIRQGARSRVVILSHINLLMIGWFIKKLSPRTQIILMSHGIEIWGRVSRAKAMMLSAVDEFWAVSQYTRQRIMESHGMDGQKVKVLNNCLDPYLPLPKNISVPRGLAQRYGIAPDDKLLFTLSRLSSKEKYKGYDDVIDALSELKHLPIKYLIGGKADATELAQLQQRIQAAGLQQQVILAGYIPDAELAAHFAMSHCYIMPSSKEGFGIVFIEAMYYGVPVIGGNADGTTDALLQGKLGTLVPPGNIAAIREAILSVLSSPQQHAPNAQSLRQHFSYPVYKQKLQALLS